MGGFVATTPVAPSRFSLSRCRVRSEHANVQRQDGQTGLSRDSKIFGPRDRRLFVSGETTKCHRGHTLQWLQEGGGFSWVKTRTQLKDELERPQSCMSLFDLNSIGGKRNP